jgi:hypothetical protein
LLALFVLTLGPAGSSSAARRAHAFVAVTPRRTVEDQPLDIRVSGLQPGARIVVGVRSTDAKGYVWESRAVFVADRHGLVDPGRARASPGRRIDDLRALVG